MKKQNVYVIVAEDRRDDDFDSYVVSAHTTMENAHKSMVKEAKRKFKEYFDKDENTLYVANDEADIMDNFENLPLYRYNIYTVPLSA